MLLTHRTPHELLHFSPGLCDSTFVAPHEWCAIKMARDYSVKKFVKNCVLMNLYTLKNYEICKFNKNKKYTVCHWPT